jgi:hypothetical protein
MTTPTIIAILKQIRSRWNKTARWSSMRVRRKIKMVRWIKPGVRGGRCNISVGVGAVS